MTLSGDPYPLPSPRPPLVLFNRYDHMDAETGVVMEVPATPDIYPIKIVGDGPKGSCAQYHEVGMETIISPR